MNVSVGTWLAQQKTKVLARTNSRNASLTPAVLHNDACGGGGGCDGDGDGGGVSSHRTAVLTTLENMIT